MLTNQDVLKKLEDFYPGRCSDGQATEITRLFSSRGMGEIEFREAFEKYRLEGRAHFLPGAQDLMPFLPCRLHWEFKPRFLHGVWIDDSNVWRELCQLWSKVKLVDFVGVLIRANKNPGMDKFLGRAMNWAGIEESRIRER